MRPKGSLAVRVSQAVRRTVDWLKAAGRAGSSPSADADARGLGEFAAPARAGDDRGAADEASGRAAAARCAWVDAAGTADGVTPQDAVRERDCTAHGGWFRAYARGANKMNAYTAGFECCGAEFSEVRSPTRAGLLSAAVKKAEEAKKKQEAEAGKKRESNASGTQTPPPVWTSPPEAAKRKAELAKKAAEAAKAKEEGEAAKKKEEAEAVKAKEEGEAAKQKQVAEAAKAEEEGEAAKKKEAEAAKAKKEGEAAKKKEAEAAKAKKEGEAAKKEEAQAAAGASEKNTPAEAQWAACAGEGTVCECTGLVRFGSSTRVYNGKSWSPTLVEVKGKLDCVTGQFGSDPHPGEPKECQCLTGGALATALPTVTPTHPPTRLWQRTSASVSTDELPKVVQQARAVRQAAEASRLAIVREWVEATAVDDATLRDVFDRSVWRTNESSRILEGRFLRALLKGDQFVMSVAGMSNTAGHDNWFNASWPIVMHRVLAPVFEAAGVAFVVRNMAMGGTGQIPYSWCLPEFLGDDTDLVGWEFMMDTAGYATASAHEQFLRAAAALPNRPPVVFNLMGPPRDDREGRKIEPRSAASRPPFWRRRDSDLFAQYAELGVHGLDLQQGIWDKDHAQPFTFTGMWMTKSFGLGGAAWHPGVTGHLAMAHSLAWYYSQVCPQKSPRCPPSENSFASRSRRPAARHPPLPALLWLGRCLHQYVCSGRKPTAEPDGAFRLP
jgi:hypothetical protein